MTEIFTAIVHLDGLRSAGETRNFLAGWITFCSKNFTSWMGRRLRRDDLDRFSAGGDLVTCFRKPVKLHYCKCCKLDLHSEYRIAIGYRIPFILQEIAYIASCGYLQN